MIRQSYTAVLERNKLWVGAFETEPYEVAWASEAIFFIRALEISGLSPGLQARVQISPDGICWCDEGTLVPLPTEPNAITFGRVGHFGGWLRLAGELPTGVQLKVIVYLSLKA
jgi:hypothetical protein